MIVVGRGTSTTSLLDGFFNRTNRKVLGEDKAVLESSDPPEVPLGREERSVANDRPTLQFLEVLLRRAQAELCLKDSRYRRAKCDASTLATDAVSRLPVGTRGETRWARARCSPARAPP